MYARTLTIGFIVLAFATAMFASDAGPGSTIVVLPFENLTGANDGEREAIALLTKSLEQKGWTVVQGDAVEHALEEERVRYLDSLDEHARLAIVEQMHAAAVLSGVLYTYRDGRGAVVALSARMVRADGTLGWGDVSGFASEDVQRVLGFGPEPTSPVLLARAVRKLMTSFPQPGSEASNVRTQAKPFYLGDPTSYRAADVDPARPHRICILPFDNLTSTLNASRIVADVLAVRLAASQTFEVVEPATLREAAAKSGITTFREITTPQLQHLARSVGTTLFLRGTIFDFVDPAGRVGADPEVQLELTLLDVESDRVIWSAQHARKGSDYTGLFLLGTVSSAVSLTDRVVAEMIDAGTRPAAKGEAAVTANGARKGPEKHSALRGAAKGNQK